MNKDFVIENDVLIKYKGTSKSVVVPEGVKKIGEKAFLEFYAKNGRNLLVITN